MKRSDVLLYEQIKMKEALHAIEVFKAIPLQPAFIKVALSYFYHNAEALIRVRTIETYQNAGGYLVIKIYAVKDLVQPKALYFDMGTGYETFKITPDKILGWEKVPKNDLPIYLGWPRTYPTLAWEIKRL